eukprot:SAG11_NODE_4481_length_1879_cov_2.100000_1_plen_145_part_00
MVYSITSTTCMHSRLVAYYECDWPSLSTPACSSQTRYPLVLNLVRATRSIRVGEPRREEYRYSPGIVVACVPRTGTGHTNRLPNKLDHDQRVLQAPSSLTSSTTRNWTQALSFSCEDLSARVEAFLTVLITIATSACRLQPPHD